MDKVQFSPARRLRASKVLLQHTYSNQATAIEIAVSVCVTVRHMWCGDEYIHQPLHHAALLLSNESSAHHISPPAETRNKGTPPTSEKGRTYTRTHYCTARTLQIKYVLHTTVDPQPKALQQVVLPSSKRQQQLQSLQTTAAD